MSKGIAAASLVAVVLGVAGYALYLEPRPAAMSDVTEASSHEPHVEQSEQPTWHTNHAPAHRTVPDETPTRSDVLRGTARLNAEQDLGAMVRSLARIAFDGDAEAQTLIARALWLCLWAAVEVPKEHEDQMVAPSYHLARIRKDVERCSSIRANDLFASLPPREGGYPYECWLDRAADSGHPVASAMRARLEISQALGQQPQDAIVAQAQADLLSAARSRHPEAMFYIGSALAVPANEEDLRGAAWTLLACRKMNCDEIPEPTFFSDCPDGLGKECARTESLIRQFEADAGPVKFARAMALSYEIEDAIEKGRWEQLDLELRIPR